MRLSEVQIQNYRSVRDTGKFKIDELKTILVGPNEAGKSAVLQALQQINPPAGVKGFDPIRDYPRALYSDINIGKVQPNTIPVVTADFALDDDDKDRISEEYRGCTYHYRRFLDNHGDHWLSGHPKTPNFASLKADLLRLAAHVDGRAPTPQEGQPPKPTAGERLSEISKTWSDTTLVTGAVATALTGWLDALVPLIDEQSDVETARWEKLQSDVRRDADTAAVLTTLVDRRPVFVLYTNYFRVKPSIHLRHLADRLEAGSLDNDQYDYGNSCLLKLLGFSARELSNLGATPEPKATDRAALQKYRDALDERSYKLNGASVKLTEEIRSIWNPDVQKAEADKLLIRADGQYLKVVVEDDLGVEVELDQRSEGFQWLVSFFVVFFAEAAGKNENAILLLDEPGLSLHGLKQRDFRQTVSRLAETNQTIYTTHSPFLVGPDELELVRVVEMTDRKVGTKVHTSVTSNDPAALLPLQEALGYDLAQSLFAQQRNLILEGLTDYWYLEAVAALLSDSGQAKLTENIALIPAKSAGKVVYFATILHAHKLKVATLLDSDAAGDTAADQDTLVHTLGNKRILRTKDYLRSVVEGAEIEDLLRDTLASIAKADFGWDATAEIQTQPHRPVVDLLSKSSPDFSKYRLAKSFVRWTRDHDATALTEDERKSWSALIQAINTALK